MSNPNKAVLKHLAIIMDGNGRWAKQRGLPRPVGHRYGVRALHETVKNCIKNSIPYLTVFAFSSENWKRSVEEVDTLMSLLLESLVHEVEQLMKQNVRLRFVGDRSQLPRAVIEEIERVEINTQLLNGLVLTIALSYGGRWDIVQAAQKVLQSGELLNEQTLQQHLALAYAPTLDLLIRTGGEQRISNFLLWQLAYAELYFCDTLWPDFSEREFHDALDTYAKRERRFGKVA